MLTKKYYKRDDLKVLGFQNLSFYANRELNKIFLTADYKANIGKSTYKISFTVEADKQKTSSRSIELLCRNMVITLDNFHNMKVTEQKKYAEENGDKID